LGRKQRFVVLLLGRLDGGEFLSGQTLASASGSEEIRHGTGKASPRKIFWRSARRFNRLRQVDAGNVWEMTAKSATRAT
jgi:hypothetical protein